MISNGKTAPYPREFKKIPAWTSHSSRERPKPRRSVTCRFSKGLRTRATAGDGNARKAEASTDDGEQRRRFAEQQPTEQDRDRRNQVGRRPHPSGGRSRERVAPRQEAKRHGSQRQVGHPADHIGTGVRKLAQENAGER